MRAEYASGSLVPLEPPRVARSKSVFFEKRRDRESGFFQEFSDSLLAILGHSGMRVGNDALFDSIRHVVAVDGIKQLFCEFDG